MTNMPIIKYRNDNAQILMGENDPNPIYIWDEKSCEEIVQSTIKTLNDEKSNAVFARYVRIVSTTYTMSSGGPDYENVTNKEMYLLASKLIEINNFPGKFDTTEKVKDVLDQIFDLNSPNRKVEIARFSKPDAIEINNSKTSLISQKIKKVADEIFNGNFSQ